MRAYVAVGSNLGDRWARLAFAARALAAEPRVAIVRASRVWDTPPLGPPQPRYLNAVLEVEAQGPPRALLAALLRIEREAGRRRGATRWAARTLDLDLLVFGGAVIREPGLEVPHPGTTTRRFVLAPLAELRPDLVVPGDGRTVAELLALAPPDDAVPVGRYPLR
ncbi:MAG TPA: 2-amino-4-hydroxy-6-hydroxymethyldihydropteridine diphosphokinase [Anaeromyxobacter sp.]